MTKLSFGLTDQNDIATLLYTMWSESISISLSLIGGNRMSGKPNRMRKGGCFVKKCTGMGKNQCSECKQSFCRKHFVQSQNVCKTCQAKLRTQNK